ncbi:hypothetical protein [Halpernia sp.]|uniref:hypothetical protein n=1 Tax=Halpernia sp. TaxID=2782209 RepID=UPI003A8E2A10
MKKIIILSSLLIAGNFFAQKKKSAISDWKNKDSEIANTIFSKSGQKSKSSDNIKKDLIELQKILKIEIINEGDWEKLNQISWFRFVKINDGNFNQIINSENLDLVANSDITNNWKDENGNISFRSISEPLKISQEYNGKKNEKGQLNTPLTANEIYETSAPVSSFSFQIYTHRKDNNSTISTNLTKTINIYENNILVKTFTYSYEDLKKVGGISVKNFSVGELK